MRATLAARPHPASGLAAPGSAAHASLLPAKPLGGRRPPVRVRRRMRPAAEAQLVLVSLCPRPPSAPCWRRRPTPACVPRRAAASCCQRCRIRLGIAAGTRR
ncbi:hypothetical protein FA09DRAFT_50907 [Tilletiopsis washingtonensis]|uniref:Uncharacterized protein n=1 Tax=Tilletiopsis washingtonensis TaxID=58919 RepID=A0A316Z8T4_9BASI|nr:hypothetical protein FA09DRAFT_50907 [Tilletiopsis washingtonensis]PWN97352.1 hypothetical protein FA09DRAFT_50907 [Tilletiopsis washingtonensis]